LVQLVGSSRAIAHVRPGRYNIRLVINYAEATHHFTHRNLIWSTGGVPALLRITLRFM
jgi:hypothetical protein